MIDWLNADSIMNGIGVERKQAESIVQGVRKISHDLETFNESDQASSYEEAFRSYQDVVEEFFGIKLGSRNVYRRLSINWESGVESGPT